MYAVAVADDSTTAHDPDRDDDHDADQKEAVAVEDALLRIGRGGRVARTARLLAHVGRLSIAGSAPGSARLSQATTGSRHFGAIA